MRKALGRCGLTGMALLVGVLGGLSVEARADDSGPIRLHPDNPHYFQWRGKTLALITSAEHYGSVLNLDFDFEKYLATLAAEGMNYTRIFTGTYLEPAGAFGIRFNTLAPAKERFLAPWARSDQPGYAGGGNKFDLDRFSPEYLERLEAFLTEANKRGIIVEVTLFCSTYSDQQWAIHPLNPANNIQAVAVKDWRRINTIENGPIMAYQEKVTRWLVRELNEHDNFFFEIQNEPWADNHYMGDFINPYLTDRHSFPNAVEVTTSNSIAWQAIIARAIIDEESRLPKKHLIAQNIANFRLQIRPDDLAPGVSIVNFHYAYPEAASWNYWLDKVIGYDETGFAGSADDTYRRQAWNFMLAGGGLFNSLDYSFTVEHEDGTERENKAPGGGSLELRRQLRVLSEFLHSFDLARLSVDRNVVKAAPGVRALALSVPGEQYAIYLEGRGPTELALALPAGNYRAEWIDVVSGKVMEGREVRSYQSECSLASPAFFATGCGAHSAEPMSARRSRNAMLEAICVAASTSDNGHRDGPCSGREARQNLHYS